jgi:undecaprenyl-diphosphatase
VAFRFHRGAGLVVALGGFLVAWSRVYCGSHWPGDLPASILLGVAVGWTATGFVGWLFRRRGWSGFPESVRQS